MKNNYTRIKFPLPISAEGDIYITAPFLTSVSRSAITSTSAGVISALAHMAAATPAASPRTMHCTVGRMAPLAMRDAETERPVTSRFSTVSGVTSRFSTVSGTAYRECALKEKYRRTLLCHRRRSRHRICRFSARWCSSWEFFFTAQAWQCFPSRCGRNPSTYLCRIHRFSGAPQR